MASVGLSTALTTALTGLNVDQQQLAVLSQNISNANTAGYSLESAGMQANYLEGNGAGVTIEEVVRQVNEHLVSTVQQQNSTVGQTTVINNYNTQIQNLLGQPGSSNSLDTFIGTFFNNVEALAQTPQNVALQQAAVDSGVTVASQVQQTATGLTNLQFQADNDIGTAVTAVNNDLTNLASVNHQIVGATLLGQSVAGLQDQRDNLLTDIAQYLNISTYTDSNGSINVTTGGVTLLDSTSTYQLSYNPAASASVFADGGSMNPLNVYATDASGNPTGSPVQIVSGGAPSAVTSTVTSGQIAGLLSIRDQEIPGLMDQVNELASNLRDQVNGIENSGVGFPGANSLTGQRLVNGTDYSQWSGNVQIAVLNSSGQPVASPYSDELNGLPPLNIDLSTLNTGNGAGNPSVQGIIDAINQYYGPQQSKVELGNLNNIQMVSDTNALPGSSGQFNFDLNLDNISAKPATVFVTGVTVDPSSGPDDSTVTLPNPNIDISSYTTSENSSKVTVNTASSTSGLTNGETVYLSGPGTTVDGIAAGDLTGTFVISNVTSNSFSVIATNGGQGSSDTTTNPVGQPTITPPYVTQAAGQNGRTNSSGLFGINLGGNTSADSYTVTLNVAVSDGSGSPAATSQITYLVTNNQAGMLNTYYPPQTADGDGVIVSPSSEQPVATAMLVDANGNPLPTDANGNYVDSEDGYLEIKAAGSTNTIAINSLNSAQQGQPNNNPPVAGSNQGFSQYFNLNNFFTANKLTATGDSVAGSAANLAVTQGLQNDPGAISLGTLVQNTQPANLSDPPNYTYVVNPGSNSVIQQLASLSTATTNFPVTGGLGATTQTFTGYAAAIIAASASNASTATTNQTNAQTLLTGFQKQASTFSGVNLDTELANTIIYQNAYAASARVITVTSTLFDTLLSSFTGG